MVSALWPDIPVAPLIVLNWLVFMIASYFLLRGRRGESRAEKHALNIWRLLLISFAIAGWFAFFNSEKII